MAKTETCRVVIDEQAIRDSTVWDIVDPVRWSVDIWKDVETYDRTLGGFSNGQRLMLALCWYLSDVKTDGHQLFYSSCTAIVWPDGNHGFGVLAMKQTLQLLVKTTWSKPKGLPESATTSCRSSWHVYSTLCRIPCHLIIESS